DGWEARRERGWSEPHRQRCLSMARDILTWPEWRELALHAQAAEDKALAWKGDTAARLLGIDSWAHHLHKVELEGARSGSWFRLLEETDTSRIDAVLEVAERVLLLEIPRAEA